MARWTPGNLGDGRKSIALAGTRERLAEPPTDEISSVVVTALVDNAGTIVVGSSTVVAALSTRRGIPLLAGDSATIQITNLHAVYLDATDNGDGVSYYTESP